MEDKTGEERRGIGWGGFAAIPVGGGIYLVSEGGGVSCLLLLLLLLLLDYACMYIHTTVCVRVGSLRCCKIYIYDQELKRKKKKKRSR
jgi:hypothetical protein